MPIVNLVDETVLLVHLWVMSIRHPHITVQLTGTDGNVFALLGRVSAALRQEGVPPEEIKQLTDDVFDAGSYEEVLAMFGRTVVVR